MWIFAEDFEGCRFTGCYNLTTLQRVDYAELADCGIMWLHYADGSRNLVFNTISQAQAAYKKIKGMLKAPLTDNEMRKVLESLQ